MIIRLKCPEDCWEASHPTSGQVMVEKLCAQSQTPELLRHSEVGMHWFTLRNPTVSLQRSQVYPWVHGPWEQETSVSVTDVAALKK